MAKVASITSGMSCEWATDAKTEMSAIEPEGLPTISVYKNLVVSSMTASKDSGSSPSTKRASIPNLPNDTSNIV